MSRLVDILADECETAVAAIRMRAALAAGVVRATTMSRAAFHLGAACAAMAR